MGKVYLVGAGLGGRAGLTQGALEILRQAEAVWVDELVDERLLAELPAQAQVWRRSGAAGLQEGLRWLIQRCREGKQVVHLKAGDPLIFGRAREEVQALREAGCPFEIWPGLSSALAGPLWAGIPLTDKHLSRAFAVLTAHELEALPWSALAQLDTLVILMGSRQRQQIADQLQEAGIPPQRAVALIWGAGQAEQQVWVGTLAELQQGEGPEAGEKLPGLLVVGEVVRLRQEFGPGIPPLPPPAPLAGKTVLVTRSEGQSPALRELLQAQGARVLEMPALVIQPPSSWDPLDAAIANLEKFDWLLLTSANGVQAFFERLQQQGRDSRALHSLQVAVVGSKTASVLAQYGIRPDLMPSEFVAEALLPIWPQPVQGQRILFPRVESGGREELVQGLRQRGAEVVEVAAYQSACPAAADPQVLEALKAHQVDILTFASSKTVQHFAHLIQQAGLGPEIWDPPVQIAAIGPKTAATCKAAFGRVDIAAQEYTLEGLVEALIQATNRST
ncbi:uroporphyrinogen-III C-methyltransferase [Synechococcus sp. 'PEA 65AY6A-5F PE A']|uniref:uroporphyrinogen-III C-methyltransferase n=1 Tax=Synechococcus sp. 'PEA 65AY6A-5F PE A' TaxID=1504259 RepID=UPI0039C22A43